MYKKGLTTYAGIAIAAVALAIGGIVFYNIQPEEDKMIEKGEAIVEEGKDMMEEGEIMMKEGEGMIEEGEKIVEEKNAIEPAL